MDQDVIIATKGINVKTMVKWIAAVWNNITTGTIQNCFANIVLVPFMGAIFQAMNM